MVAFLPMVTALLIGLALGWHEASAHPDWRTIPVIHAPDGPIIAR